MASDAQNLTAPTPASPPLNPADPQLLTIAPGNLVTLLGRALGLTEGFSNKTLMEATTHFDAMCEGLAMLERRGVLPIG